MALSIAVGVFAVGFVAGTYLILRQDVSADFLAVNPHAAVLYAEDFDGGLLDGLRRLPGVARVEGRSVVTVNLLTPDGSSYPLQVYGVPPLADMQIDRLRLEQGEAQPGKHALYLERQVAGKLGYQAGDTVEIYLNDGARREMRAGGGGPGCDRRLVLIFRAGQRLHQRGPHWSGWAAAISGLAWCSHFPMPGRMKLRCIPWRKPSKISWRPAACRCTPL